MIKKTKLDSKFKNKKRKIIKKKSVIVSDVLTEAEYLLMLDRCDNQRNRYIISLLWNTGLRRQELCGLNCVDVMDKDILILRQEIAKGSKERYIPLTDEAKIAIDFFIKQNKKYGFKITKRLPLIVSRQKCRISDKMVYNIVKKAGITVERNIAPHALRSGMATYLINKGANIKDVQLILGHSNYDITAKSYLKRNMEDLKNTISLISKNNKQ